MPTRMLCVYGIPLIPIRSAYRTHGLADTGIHTIPMKNGTTHMLLNEATRERSPVFSESHPVTRRLMVNKTNPGIASMFESNTE
jgi:hypothetical protein